MSTVLIEGSFLNAEIKTSSFDGKEKTSVYIDVYQQDSESSNKLVQVKSDDVKLYQSLINDYAGGSVIKLKCLVNAYQNKAYFKLVDVM